MSSEAKDKNGKKTITRHERVRVFFLLIFKIFFCRRAIETWRPQSMSVITITGSSHADLGRVAYTPSTGRLPRAACRPVDVPRAAIDRVREEKVRWRRRSYPTRRKLLFAKLWLLYVTPVRMDGRRAVSPGFFPGLLVTLVMWPNACLMFGLPTHFSFNGCLLFKYKINDGKEAR